MEISALEFSTLHIFFKLGQVTQTGHCSLVSCEQYVQTLRKNAIMQRGSIEHEQIIYGSSNRRMKQLMDWPSNSHCIHFPT